MAGAYVIMPVGYHAVVCAEATDKSETLTPAEAAPEKAATARVEQ